MKIDGTTTLLTLCAFLPTTTTAFISQSTALFKGSKSSNASPSFSYLGNLGASEGSSYTTSRYTLEKDATKTKVNGDAYSYGVKTAVNGDVKSDYTVR
jgi:hypothetical protein